MFLESRKMRKSLRANCFFIRMPPAEVTNIALHIIDAEAEQSDMGATVMATRVIEAVTAIVAEHLGEPDTSSFTYARFVMHLRYSRRSHTHHEKTPVYRRILVTGMTSF